MYAKKSELKVGILVIVASIGLLALLYFATGEAYFKDWRTVQMRLQPGDLAPVQGDQIFMNGVEIGRVESVAFGSEKRSGERLSKLDRAWLEGQRVLGGDEMPDAIREFFVHIEAKIEAHVVLPVGSKGLIQRTLTGSKTLSIVPSLHVRDLTDQDTETTPIIVHQVPTLAGLTKAASGAVGTASEALLEVKGLAAEVREKIAAGRVDEMLSDVREAAGSLRRLIEGLERDMQVVTANVGDASGDVKEVAAAAVRIAEALEEDLPAAVQDVRDLVAKVTTVVDKAAPKVDVFLDDVNQTGKNLVALSEEFAGIGPEARVMVEELGRDLDEVASILTDTGRNLLDASEDLRAHPWKLLNEPSTDEIAYENLRQTMVNYVRAMQRMDMAAERLQSLLADGATDSPEVRVLIANTLAEFERSNDAYRSSEARLIQLLRAGAPGAPPPKKR